MAYDIVLSHFKNTTSKTPLKMIIQGTAGTGKSFLISCLSDAFLSTCPGKPSPLLLLAPTGVAAFHINAQTIHSALRIPISNMHPLEGQSLLQLQEQLRHVEYILIDEMSFIGPTMLSQIDARLRQAFPSHSNSPFGGRSIILVGDLGQLPPVKDIPMYVGTSHGNALWRTFDTIVTLGTVFRQQGDNALQIAFRSLLANLRNATPTIEDWNLLMSRTDSNMSDAEIQTFEEPIHLYATNQCVALHNKQMLKKLNMPIARSYAEQTKSKGPGTHEDEQLDAKVLLCVGQQVLLTTNLWVETGLVNGALGKVISILYAMHSKPPDLPLFVVIDFVHYKGPPWDVNNPKQVPISPISRGSHRQLPIRMAWGLTIHKSQGMTLPKATIDIGNIDRQGLTFTAISRVKSLSGLRISPAFTYTRYSRMEDNPYVNRRKREEALLSSKSLMPPT